ncbi:MAG: SEC-C domain-containing protein [Gammaproteobacteria bacterium]
MYRDLHADDDALQTLLRASARVLRANPEPGPFLDWIATAGPDLAPIVAGQIAPGTARTEQIFRPLGIEIYNAMPQAGAGYRPSKLPLPGRNAPCICGSGRKYKQCCLALAGALELGEFNLLRFVLDELPESEFPSLPATHIDVLAVADTAMQWHDEDRVERAATLLEAWFDSDAGRPDTLEPLFEELIECYLTLGDDAARDELIADASRRGTPLLRSAALQRQSAAEAERGDSAAAWQAFQAAQRADPDNPGLATLEMMLLVQRDEIAQARARARFWISRFERAGDPLLADLIDFLGAAERDPRAALASLEESTLPLDEVPEARQLTAILEGAPPPECAYRVRSHGVAGNELVAAVELQAVEKRWRNVYLQPKPLNGRLAAESDEIWDEAEAWMRFLTRNPLAWQSFDVLDDLVLAAAILPSSENNDGLFDALLERALALVDENCAAVLAAGRSLPWTWMKNRPLLRLLTQGALNPPAAPRTDLVELMGVRATQLLSLDPADTFGVREPLSRLWLEQGRFDEVLELTARFPDDGCAMGCNRLLALFRLGQQAEATVLLRELACRHPRALELLLADRAPRKPRPDPESGRYDEALAAAWQYRQDSRAQWLEDGALEWLRAAWDGQGA